MTFIVPTYNSRDEFEAAHPPPPGASDLRRQLRYEQWRSVATATTKKAHVEFVEASAHALESGQKLREGLTPRAIPADASEKLVYPLALLAAGPPEHPDVRRLLAAHHHATLAKESLSTPATLDSAISHVANACRAEDRLLEILSHDDWKNLERALSARSLQSSLESVPSFENQAPPSESLLDLFIMYVESHDVPAAIACFELLRRRSVPYALMPHLTAAVEIDPLYFGLLRAQLMTSWNANPIAVSFDGGPAFLPGKNLLDNVIDDLTRVIGCAEASAPSPEDNSHALLFFMRGAAYHIRGRGPADHAGACDDLMSYLRNAAPGGLNEAHVYERLALLALSGGTLDEKGFSLRPTQFRISGPELTLSLYWRGKAHEAYAHRLSVFANCSRASTPETSDIMSILKIKFSAARRFCALPGCKKAASSVCKNCGTAYCSRCVHVVGGRDVGCELEFLLLCARFI